MRWGYEDFDAKIKRLSKWRPWFAWYPVKMGNEKVWLEKIYRRYKVYSGPGEYVYEPQYTDTMGLLKYKKLESEYDGLE